MQSLSLVLTHFHTKPVVYSAIKQLHIHWDTPPPLLESYNEPTMPTFPMRMISIYISNTGTLHFSSAQLPLSVWSSVIRHIFYAAKQIRSKRATDAKLNLKRGVVLLKVLILSLRCFVVMLYNLQLKNSLFFYCWCCKKPSFQLLPETLTC